jgi:hypothetical protein
LKKVRFPQFILTIWETMTKIYAILFIAVTFRYIPKRKIQWQRLHQR